MKPISKKGSSGFSRDILFNPKNKFVRILNLFFANSFTFNVIVWLVFIIQVVVVLVCIFLHNIYMAPFLVLSVLWLIFIINAKNNSTTHNVKQIIDVANAYIDMDKQSQKKYKEIMHDVFVESYSSGPWPYKLEDIISVFKLHSKRKDIAEEINRIKAEQDTLADIMEEFK